MEEFITNKKLENIMFSIPNQFYLAFKDGAASNSQKYDETGLQCCGSVFGNFVDPDPYSEYDSESKLGQILDPDPN